MRMHAAFPALVGVCGAVFAVAPVGDTPAGRWLVERGWKIAAQAGPSPTGDDAARVLIWMEAAVRVNPDLADAYLWQYDLLTRLDRTDAAMAALASYCRLRPGDVAARLDLIEWRFSHGQSVEGRLRFCASELEDPSLTPGARSDLHRRMSALLFRSGATDEAEDHAFRAVQAVFCNLAAHQLLVELADDQELPARQARMLLAAIAASPASYANIWRLARLLDDLSLHAEAAVWYAHLMATGNEGAHPDGPPVALVMDYATSLADAGKLESAAELAERVLRSDPEAVSARLLLVRLHRAAGRPDAAEPHAAALDRRFAVLDPDSPGASDPAILAQAIDYYLEDAPDTSRAVRLATAARKLAPGSAVLEVLYGRSKLAAGEPDEALAALQPHATTDPWAALALGEALAARGAVREAIEAWRRGEALRGTGRAYERITAALAAHGEDRAPAPRHAAVREALSRFDPDTLSLRARASAALRLEASLVAGPWEFGDPWICRWRLTNTSGLPVTVGDDAKVSGRALVDLRWGEGPGEQLRGYLPLSLSLRPVLAAGESVVHTQALDVGPAAALAQSAPQRELALEFRVVPAPAGTGDAGATVGLSPVTMRTLRRAVDASATGIRALGTVLRDGREAQRVRAARTLAALLAEHELGRGAPPGYDRRSIDRIKVRRWVRAALADPAPLVRAAALDSMRALEWGPRMLEAAAPLLSDPSWLVRLVAVDALADCQGEGFRPVLERLSSADPDELVRRLAESRLKALPPGGD